MARCMKCGRVLVNDEIGMHKKMINRAAREFMCLSCLAAEYRCSEELLRKKMEQFRRMGCMLFAPADDE